MRNQWFEFIAGSIVLLIAAVFIVVGFQKYIFTSTGQSYNMVASFTSAEGISVGTDVRMAGVKIGSITNLSLNTETLSADATLSVRNGIEIPDDSIISIASEGLLGGHFIQVQPGGSMFSYAAGEVINDTQGAVSLTSLLMKFVASSSQN